MIEHDDRWIEYSHGDYRASPSEKVNMQIVVLDKPTSWKWRIIITDPDGRGVFKGTERGITLDQVKARVDQVYAIISAPAVPHE